MNGLPAGWRATTLGQVGSWGSGGTPQAGNPAFYWGTIPWAVIGDLNDGVVTDTASTITPAGLAHSSAKLVPAGAILVAMYGSIGKLGIAGREMATNQAIAFVVPNQDVLPRYLFFYLQSQKRALDSAGKGAAQRNISQTILKSWPITYPAVHEQRRIVAILEEHLSSLDAARRSLDSARQRLSVLQRSLIDRLASGQIIGPITETGLAAEWQWRSPVELAAPGRGSIAIGPFGSDLKTSDYRDSGVPLVFVRNVRASQFGVGNAKYVSAPKAASLTGHDVRRGDVLITKMGEPPGDAAVYDSPIPGIVTADVIRFRPGPDTDSAFLAAAINSSLVRRQILTITSGVAQKKVSLARFRANIEIPAPGLEMQLAAVRAVEPHLESARRLQSALASSEVRLQSLRRGVLTAAFSGRLTGRSSDSELVEELADQEAS